MLSHFNHKKTIYMIFKNSCVTKKIICHIIKATSFVFYLWINIAF